MAKKAVAPMRAAADALAILGDQIHMARHEKNWTAAELAQRVGVSAPTVTALEAGSPGSAIGTVFNAAAVLGIPLFSPDRDELARLRRQGRERAALLPSRVYHPRTKDDADDFAF